MTNLSTYLVNLDTHMIVKADEMIDPNGRYETRLNTTRTHTKIESGTEDYGITDTKGRKIGYRWSIERIDARPLTVEQYDALVATRDHYSVYSPLASKPLTHFEVRGNPTRNGERYGCSNHTDCATLEDAKANVAKRIATARKRDAKKFA